MEYLSALENGKFKNADAVKFLYSDELTDQNYMQLQNRYFKLRKKLMEFYKRESSDIENLLTHEEYLFAKCRQLIQKKDIETARKELAELGQRCWDLNIFELLPDVLNRMIYCNQVFQRLDDNEELFSQMKVAIELEADVKLMHMLFQQAYGVVVEKGYNASLSYFRKMKVLYLKHKGFPRFQMMYHLYNIALGTAFQGKNFQALMRHQNAFKAIRAKHPEMPCENYQPNHIENTAAYMFGRQLAMHYIKGDAETSYHIMLEYWSLLNKGKGYLRIGLRDYVNRILIENTTGRYENALETAQNLLQFIKENDKSGNVLEAYHYVTQCYRSGFPELRCKNPQFYLGKVDKYIEQLSETDSSLLGDVHLTRAELCLLYKMHRKAANSIAHASCQEFLKSLNMPEIFQTCFDYTLSMLKGDSDDTQYSPLRQELKAASQKHQAELQTFHHLEWLLRTMTYIRKRTKNH